MKKMFFLAVLTIAIITLIFLFYSSDINIINKKFLSKFEIRIKPTPVSFEYLTIPETFDLVYQNYNLMQAEAGMDLFKYRGKKAIRYTYEVTNFPDKSKSPIYANVICVNGNPVCGDIMCTDLDGFILPLNYLINHSRDNIQYQNPARNDAPIP